MPTQAEDWHGSVPTVVSMADVVINSRGFVWNEKVHAVWLPIGRLLSCGANVVWFDPKSIRSSIFLYEPPTLHCPRPTHGLTGGPLSSWFREKPRLGFSSGPAVECLIRARVVVAVFASPHLMRRRNPTVVARSGQAREEFPRQSILLARKTLFGSPTLEFETT